MKKEEISNLVELNNQLVEQCKVICYNYTKAYERYLNGYYLKYGNGNTELINIIKSNTINNAFDYDEVQLLPTDEYDGIMTFNSEYIKVKGLSQDSAWGLDTVNNFIPIHIIENFENFEYVYEEIEIEVYNLLDKVIDKYFKDKEINEIKLKEKRDIEESEEYKEMMRLAEKFGKTVVSSFNFY